MQDVISGSYGELPNPWFMILLLDQENDVPKRRLHSLVVWGPLYIPCTLIAQLGLMILTLHQNCKMDTSTLTICFFFFSLFFFLIPDFFSLVSEHIKQHKLGIARFLGWVKEWLDCLEHTRAWSLEPCLCLHTFSCDISTLSFAQFLVLLNTSIIFTC
eukprot:TRINITY_DN44805_c0_g1_i1.p1 TRINITY_DN44805_c0_g1~~TRINITY_DN44805_c0_g1_i1.p1  ORF type:complete len:158 (-),score=11.70 TRINITY_DN44805_c0_g1_i1:511-984(-)